MKCPYCANPDSKVIDSREAADSVRRRRECLSCLARFTTYERVERLPLYVIKKDKRREEFDRHKLLSGLHKACDKRPLATGAVEKLAEDIEAEVYQMGKTEVTGSVIGDLVMAGLKRLDHVAYIRFASVYREFTDIAAMKQEVDTLVSQPPLLPDLEMVALQKGAPKLRRRSRAG
jgi:transcriptional repressor NrdR